MYAWFYNKLSNICNYIYSLNQPLTSSITRSIIYLITFNHRTPFTNTHHRLNSHSLNHPYAQSHTHSSTHPLIQSISQWITHPIAPSPAPGHCLNHVLTIIQSHPLVHSTTDLINTFPHPPIKSHQPFQTIATHTLNHRPINTPIPSNCLTHFLAHQPTKSHKY